MDAQLVTLRRRPRGHIPEKLHADSTARSGAMDVEAVLLHALACRLLRIPLLPVALGTHQQEIPPPPAKRKGARGDMGRPPRRCIREVGVTSGPPSYDSNSKRGLTCCVEKRQKGMSGFLWHAKGWRCCERVPASEALCIGSRSAERSSRTQNAACPG